MWLAVKSLPLPIYSSHERIKVMVLDNAVISCSLQETVYDYFHCCRPDHPDPNLLCQCPCIASIIINQFCPVYIPLLDIFNRVIL